MYLVLCFIQLNNQNEHELRTTDLLLKVGSVTFLIHLICKAITKFEGKKNPQMASFL